MPGTYECRFEFFKKKKMKICQKFCKKNLFPPLLSISDKFFFLLFFIRNHWHDFIEGKNVFLPVKNVKIISIFWTQFFSHRKYILRSINKIRANQIEIFEKKIYILSPLDGDCVSNFEIFKIFQFSKVFSILVFFF